MHGCDEFLCSMRLYWYVFCMHLCVVCVCVRVCVYPRKDDTEVEETRMELMGLEQTASPTSPTSLTLTFSATSIDKSDVISEVEAERITDGDSSVMFF
jgi:hypothetical protein